MKTLLFLTVLFFVPPLKAQMESVPVGHPVYDYLYEVKTAGLLPEYSNIILPLEKAAVGALLDSLAKREQLLTDETLRRFRHEFSRDHSLSPAALTGNNAISATEHFLAEYPSSVYAFSDSVFRFSFGLTAYSQALAKGEGENGSGTLLDAGGARLFLHFRESFGAELSVTNGTNFGDRDAARLNPYVENSFTFNTTGRENFDFTKGYARFRLPYVAVYFGREKTNFGRSPLEPAVLGNVHPPFDYLLLRFTYKDVTYDFLHGWLVTRRQIRRMEDNDVEFVKNPKQIATSRAGVNFHKRFSAGIGQTIIYSGRSFEATYCNPFLFWESAQRSLNDVDNSFLFLDWEWQPAAGISHSGTVMLDDMEFSNLFTKGFGTKSNTSLWQGSLSFARPLLPSGMTAILDVCLIRPFTFTHPGYMQALNYTNNGKLLGVDAMPNSLLITSELRWRAATALLLKLQYRYLKHGMNVTDSTGAVILNAGGDITKTFDFSVPDVIPQFGGNRETVHRGAISLLWYLSANVNCSGWCSFSSRSLPGKTTHPFTAGIGVFYNWY